MREDIIRMAREAGWDMDDTVDGFSVRLERFFNLAYAAGASAEREACARLCDELQSIPATEPRHCAEDIRARGQDPMPLFDDWGGIPYKSCPPCNQQCNQGRDCPNA